MGGGHLTREERYITQPDPHNPMTEFYLLFQQGMAQHRQFSLPGCWVAFRPPQEEPLYAEDMPEYCTFSGEKRQGWREVFAPRQLSVLYESLRLMRDGTPAALVLTEEATRHTWAVQLLPPFAGAGVNVPPMPDCYAGLTIQLTPQDLDTADTDPAKLARQLLSRTTGKQWHHHPAMERWMHTALAAAQRDFRRRENYY